MLYAPLPFELFPKLCADVPYHVQTALVVDISGLEICYDKYQVFVILADRP